MKINWQKVGAFFGMPESATPAEVDARLDSELAARKDAETAPEARDKGEDKGADAGAEAADKQTETTPAGNDAEAGNDTPALTAEDVTAAVTVAVSAAVKPLAERLAKIEGADAAPPAGGQTDAPEVKTDDAPLYASNPINQRVAARLKGNK